MKPSKGLLPIELGLRLAIFEILCQVSALIQPKRWRQNSNSASPSETSMVNHPLSLKRHIRYLLKVDKMSESVKNLEEIWRKSKNRALKKYGKKCYLDFHQSSFLIRNPFRCYFHYFHVFQRHGEPILFHLCSNCHKSCNIKGLG